MTKRRMSKKGLSKGKGKDGERTVRKGSPDFDGNSKLGRVGVKSKNGRGKKLDVAQGKKEKGRQQTARKSANKDGNFQTMRKFAANHMPPSMKYVGAIGLGARARVIGFINEVRS